MTKLPERIHIAPAIWPGRTLKVQPGDLAHFVPPGLGLAAPAVMRPWDSLGDLPSRANCYGFGQPSIHPFLNAPVNDACGAVVYFDGNPRREQFDSLLQLLDVSGALQEYAAFWAESADPKTERYLQQLRIIGRSTLTSIFGAEVSDEQDTFLKQNLVVEDALWAFIADQQETFSRSELRGVMGGDGDWAKEDLAFGFMVENSYNHVYRIWSRPWLVTK